eukprot:scaffold4962_cov97-Isochrysis_galbana.AAC.2
MLVRSEGAARTMYGCTEPIIGLRRPIYLPSTHLQDKQTAAVPSITITSLTPHLSHHIHVSHLSRTALTAPAAAAAALIRRHASSAPPQSSVPPCRCR